MATFFAEEIIEAIRYLEDPGLLHQAGGARPTITSGWAPPTTSSCASAASSSWTAPRRGSPQYWARPRTKRLPSKSPASFSRRTSTCSCPPGDNGTSFTKQLLDADVQVGWPTRLVPFGPDVSATVFAAGFATRAALSFGGIEPGDYRKILIYNKDRVFAFALPMGYVSDEWYANAAGAINYGFPVIADTPIPQILPTGICTYEHVVSNIPHDELVAKAVEVRGLKTSRLGDTHPHRIRGGLRGRAHPQGHVVPGVRRRLHPDGRMGHLQTDGRGRGRQGRGYRPGHSRQYPPNPTCPWR